MTSSRSAFLLAAGAVCALTTTGRAQDAYPNVAPSTLDAYMSSHIDGLSLGSVGGNSASGGRRSSSSRRSARASAAFPASTAYFPSSIVSAQVRDKAIKRVRAVSSGDANKIAALLQKTSAASLWQRATAHYGLRTGDMADAMASYWVINYMVVNDVPEVSAASVRGARDQFKRLLLGAPVLAQQSNATKQRLSEELYFKYLFQHSALEQMNKTGSGDSTAKAKLRNSARTQFRDQMGIDLQRFTLTPAGFRAKS